MVGMKDKIRELLKESAESKETVMGAWELFFIAAFVLVGVLFRKKIIQYYKKDKEPIEPPFQPLPEEPKEEEPTKPVGEVILKTEPREFDGSNFTEIKDEGNLSFVNEKGDDSFALRIPLRIDEVKNSTILGKSEPNNIEWMVQLRTDTGIELSLRGKDNDSITKYVPIEKVPIGEKFYLGFTYNGSQYRKFITANINGRAIETHSIADGYYSGMKKTEASITIGGNKFGDKFNFVGWIGEVIIDKGKEWGSKDFYYDYKQLFGVEDIFIKPDADGVFRCPIEPDTGEDVTEAVNDWFQNLPSGEEGNILPIYIKPGYYWVERSTLDGGDNRGCIDLFDKHYWKVYSDSEDAKAVFFTEAPATPYKGGESGREVSKRSTIKGQYCKEIEFEFIDVEGSNTIDQFLIGSEGYKPEWWGRTQEFKGRLLGKGPYEPTWAHEHGFNFTNSEDITFRKCRVYGVWGDGFYGDTITRPKLIDCVTHMTARMGAGFANDTYDLLIDGFKASGTTRAAIDLEPQLGGIIDRVEIKNCYLDGHLAAAGFGQVNNVYIHDNGIGHILFRGTDSIVINPITGEQRSLHRYNLRIEDNYRVGGHGSPMADIQVFEVTNVSIKRNQLEIAANQGRHAIDLYKCGGKIEIEDNDFRNASKITIRETYPNADITVERNTPDEVIELADYYVRARPHLDKIQEPLIITYAE